MQSASKSSTPGVSRRALPPTCISNGTCWRRIQDWVSVGHSLAEGRARTPSFQILSAGNAIRLNVNAESRLFSSPEHGPGRICHLAEDAWRRSRYPRPRPLISGREADEVCRDHAALPPDLIIEWAPTNPSRQSVRPISARSRSSWPRDEAGTTTGRPSSSREATSEYVSWPPPVRTLPISGALPKSFYWLATQEGT